jgi:hypothetical protein
MINRKIIFVGLLFYCISCKSASPPKLIKLPPTKTSTIAQQDETIFTMGYMSGYDIWEFLKEEPSQKDVLETFGLPDSVWLDDIQTTKFLYYFISDMHDYNTK